MSKRHKSFWSTGEPFIWLTGGALTLALLLVVGLITFILLAAWLDADDRPARLVKTHEEIYLDLQGKTK